MAIANYKAKIKKQLNTVFQKNKKINPTRYNQMGIKSVNSSITIVNTSFGNKNNIIKPFAHFNLLFFQKNCKLHRLHL